MDPVSFSVIQSDTFVHVVKSIDDILIRKSFLDGFADLPQAIL